MGNRRYLGEFLRYTVLNVLGMTALSCYILADTFFISRALGADGLTALNLSIPVYSFIHGSGLMIGMGGGIRYSIVKSQGDTGRGDQIFTNSAVLTGGIAAVFFLLGLLASEPLALLLGANGAVYGMTRTYLRILLLFAPMFMTNNLILCFVRNDGAPQLSMAAMITGSLSNVVLDYVFMFPFGMGIFGAVLATGLAPVISLGVLSLHFFRGRNQFRLRKCRVSVRLTAAVFSNGVPSLITEVSSGTVILVFNRIILDIAGNTGVAAYGVIANLSLVVMSVYTGIAQGIQPLLSRARGEGDVRKIRGILRYAVTAAVLISAAVCLGIFFGADPITAVFNSEGNAMLQRIAVTGLKIYFTAAVFAGVNIILSAFFAATERAFPAQLISLLRGFILIIPAAFLLSAAAGLPGVWASFPVTEAAACLAGTGLLHLEQRKRTGPGAGR